MPSIASSYEVRHESNVMTTHAVLYTVGFLTVKDQEQGRILKREVFEDVMRNNVTVYILKCFHSLFELNHNKIKQLTA